MPNPNLRPLLESPLQQEENPFNAEFQRLVASYGEPVDTVPEAIWTAPSGLTWRQVQVILLVTWPVLSQGEHLSLSLLPDGRIVEVREGPR